MNRTEIIESISAMFDNLNRIEDELEVRPGTKTIRGTDGGVIDAAEIREALEVLRDDLRFIEAELAKEPT